MIVALTGFMASGKTTFGRAAAAQLGRAFIDLDEAIASRYGSPARPFDSRGEAAFRQNESDLLEEVLQTQRDTVLALGGGTILREENLRRIRSAGARILWLDTAFDIILSEIDNSDRPLVRDKSVSQIRALYDARRPLYEAAADLIFPIHSTDYVQVIADLAKTIQSL